MAHERGGDGRRDRVWRAVFWGTLAATGSLIVLGALTRASLAGMACPDWPLCHGYVVPPLDPAAYPSATEYPVHKVYLEFLHRALAAAVSLGAVALAARSWRSGRRAVAGALIGLLAAQVLAGAITVWLQNSPLTVVLHLALALGFLSALLATRPAAAEPVSPAVRRLTLGLLAAIGLQMLVGAVVSSSSFGLACEGYPFCSGLSILPESWDLASSWQMAHRGLGLLAVGAAASLVAAAHRDDPRRRRLAAWMLAGLLAQTLLGGLNVWLRVPPWASAAHLGLAALLFGALAREILAATRSARPLAARREPSEARLRSA